MRYALFLALAMTGVAQQIDLTSLDRLVPRAEEAANVDLDSEKIKLASMFLSGNESGTKQAKGLVEGLKGIYVRAFEFAKPGEFADSDLDGIRSQLKHPNWSRLVNVRGKQESAEVWFWMEAGKLGGLVVLASEPKELVAVNIVGPIDIATLANLSGKLGIPAMTGDLMKSMGKPPASTVPKQEE